MNNKIKMGGNDNREWLENFLVRLDFKECI